MNKAISMTLLAASLTLGGCAANYQANNTQKGAAIGAVVGAILGKATGDHDKKRYAWGAVVGAIAGGAIGNYMDKQEAALREELADSGIEVVRTGNNIDLIMPSDVTFATNSASVSQSFTPVLQDVARVLNEYEKTVLMIEGHTDSDGTEQYNQGLSERRAESVKNILLANSVNARRMTTLGMGEYQPKASNATPEGKQQNRRVELTIQPLGE
ncbi:OmpA family protein [Alteromonas sediminis]|uniref:OmpA family protein n=1 Tax=Alteromonas sediminis TaxID=2259342 RepID=A0A3N5XZK2_9ALTE|nr:OmpA family protein [Alteromonas sediminis]RPJ66747.1 OmpA family protein [Alteromonas sediminis]